MKNALEKENIRIGTLVNGAGAGNYIRQILPHGFESFSITFWQTLGQTDLKKLAAEVKEALGDSGAVISSVCGLPNTAAGTSCGSARLTLKSRPCGSRANGRRGPRSTSRSNRVATTEKRPPAPTPCSPPASAGWSSPCEIRFPRSKAAASPRCRPLDSRSKSDCSKLRPRGEMRRI